MRVVSSFAEFTRLSRESIVAGFWARTPGIAAEMSKSDRILFKCDAVCCRN